MRQRFVMSVIGIVWTLTGSAAHAWGDDGHKVVAGIAYELLTPSAKAAADALLAADADTLTAPDFASRATWADRYRDSNNRHDHYVQTSKWHFTDVEISGPDLTTACFDFPALPTGVVAADLAAPASDCAPHKVEQFAAELANPAVPMPERILALKFILHFVGDMHQPLHSSDDHDAGGNCEAVRLGDTGPSLRLHHYWDTEVVQAVLATYRQRSGQLQASYADLAHALATGIAPADRAAWEAGEPRLWTQEAFEVAHDFAYGALPPHPACPSGPAAAALAAYPPFVLPVDYQQRAAGIAQQQLVKAGVRLAAVLNQSLTASPIATGRVHATRHGRIRRRPTQKIARLDVRAELHSYSSAGHHHGAG